MLGKSESGNAAASTSKQVSSEKESSSHLNLYSNIKGKSSADDSEKTKGSKTAYSVNNKKQYQRRKRKRERIDSQNNMQKFSSSDLGNNQEGTNKQKGDFGGGVNKKDNMPQDELGGVIFMCNAKTKPDCFRYGVMGVSSSKKELVLSIKPGLKLFLYDFDLKLMYGVYRSSSEGGMKLESAAFGGAFPAQVRFAVETDSLPLTESLFKKAIKDNYDEKTHKFKTELTIKQVKHLTKLFRAAPWLSSHPKSALKKSIPVASIRSLPAVTSSNEEILREQVYRDAGGRPIPFDYERQWQYPERHVSHREMPSHQPISLTDKEYRRYYGLQQGRHLLQTGPAVGLSNNFDSQRTQLPGLPASLPRNEVSSRGSFFLTEKEYRTHGLRGCPELPKPAPITESNHALGQLNKEIYNPYDDSTISLVNRYLSLPRLAGTDDVSYSPMARQTCRYHDYTSETRDQPQGVISDRRTLHTAYYSRAPSHAPSSSVLSRAPPDFQRFHQLGEEPDLAPATVSSHYSFAGPSLLRR